MDIINFDDFKKLDIKIGKVLSCEKIPETDKLLKLKIDFGEEQRTVVTGMAEFYDSKDFVGKQIPILVNLEPRKLKGVESQGMILAVDVEGKPVLLHPREEVPNGSSIR